MRFCALVGLVFLVPLGLLSIWSERYWLGSTLLIFAVVFFWLLRFTRDPRNIIWVRGTTCVLISLLSLYLILWGGAYGAGVYYSFALCVLTISFAGHQAGRWVALAILAILSLAFYSDYSGFYPYPATHKLRIFLAIGLTFMMTLIFEWMRMRSYGALSEQSESHKQSSATDPLTGLLNRVGLEQGLERWKEEQFPAVLAIIDLDNFKKINDSYGHHAGDMALIAITQVFRRHTKGRDLIARWGGEEFALVLAASSKQNLIKVLSDVRSTLKSTLIEHGENKFNIGFSAGVSRLASLNDWEQALALADKRLYIAKNSGRDKVVADS